MARGRPVSIGARWTLRFTLAMMVAVSATSLVNYKQAESRLWQDVELLIELQASEIAEELERHAGDPEAVSEYVDQHVESARPDLELGIRLLHSDGGVRLERGSLAFLPIPAPPAPADAAREGALQRVPVEDHAPFVTRVYEVDSGWVQIALSARPFLRSVRDVRNSFLTTIPVALLGTALLGWWLARRSLAPIAQMTATARRINAFQLDETLPTSGSGDELDRLAQTMNEMLARIHAGVERLRAFTVHAAHQLRTPLSLVRSRLELAASGPREPEADAAAIRDSLRDVERIGRVIQGMLRLARSEGGLRPGQAQRVDLAELLAAVVEFFEPLASERDVELRLVETVPVPLDGDPEWLHELFVNLVDNAVRYTPAGGRVDVAVRREPGEAAVTVRDTGPGIPARDRERLFERFHRGEAAAGVPGVGLGLALANEIARAHGGRIELETEVGAGSTFTARLPLPPGVPPRARPSRKGASER